MFLVMSNTKTPVRREDGGSTVINHPTPILVSKPKTENKKPQLWKVLIFNDDYTTTDFVVWLLETVFKKPNAEAVQIMLDVHNKGIGVAGVYSYEIAETKVLEATATAQRAEHPLKLDLEPE